MKIHPSGAPRMQRQLLQKPARPLRSALREYIVERVQPLPRFQDFDTVRLLRLSHSDLTNKNAIFHHKQSGRILLESRAEKAINHQGTKDHEGNPGIIKRISRSPVPCRLSLGQRCASDQRRAYSNVTAFTRLRGRSTSSPRLAAT